MSHFVTVWQLLVCLAVVLALYFHRIILGTVVKRIKLYNELIANAI